MATDLHGTELMYNRIIGPRTNALSVDQHKSRHGIRLRSMSFPRKTRRGLRSPSSPALSMTTPIATQLVPMVTSSSALLQREKSFPGAAPKSGSMVPTTPQAGTPEPEVIEEEVFPMQYPLLHDEMNRQRAIAAQSFSAGLKIKQVPLPQLYKQEKDQPRSRTPSARGVRTVPVYKDRETPSPAPQATTSRLYLRDTRSPIRNMSEQQRRLQDEEKARMRTKVMKRTAEIVSHRVDRMYYMMGSNVPLLYRYQVDEDELNRLRELSHARSSTSHYGRGLSKYRFVGTEAWTVDPLLPRIGSREEIALYAAKLQAQIERQELQAKEQMYRQEKQAVEQTDAEIKAIEQANRLARQVQEGSSRIDILIQTGRLSAQSSGKADSEGIQHPELFSRKYKQPPVQPSRKHAKSADWQQRKTFLQARSHIQVPGQAERQTTIFPQYRLKLGAYPGMDLTIVGQGRFFSSDTGIYRERLKGE
ncbi:hypothetical protein Bbelb_177580 [Branchiostoma belcheri]|nr:hypothetical protein Bbelb_177580 [Branchiostoma belcheri]